MSAAFNVQLDDLIPTFHVGIYTQYPADISQLFYMNTGVLRCRRPICAVK
jgi:hypothetical protein